MHNAQDLTTGSIWKGLARFFFPILLGVVFQQLYNTVDSIVVGNFVGKEALAAVGGSAAQLINLLVGFFLGLSSGATVLIAQYYGGRQHTALRSALHTAVAFSLLGGALLTVTGLLVSRPGLLWMDTPADTMDYSLQYLRIIFLGIIPSLLYNMGSGILRAVGDSRRPLLYLIVCCVTNTVLDLLFVAVLDWEVAGVAVATVLAQAVSAVLTLGALRRLPEAWGFRWRAVRLAARDLRGILRIGLPSAVQSCTYGVSNLLLLASVNTLGTDAVAGWTAAGKVDSIFWMIMSAFGTTVLTFTGQNVGAGLLPRAKRGIRFSLLTALATAAVVSSLLLAFGRVLLGIFTKDAGVLDAGYLVLLYCVPSYVAWVLVEIFSGALRGAGDALVPMVINLVGTCALRLVWLYTAVPMNHTIGMLCLSYPITWVLTGGAFLIYYLRGSWTRRLTLHAQET